MSRGKNDPIEILIGMMLGGSFTKQLADIIIEYVDQIIKYDPDGQGLVKIDLDGRSPINELDRPIKLTREQKRDFCREALSLHVRVETARGTLKTSYEESYEEACSAIDQALDEYYRRHPERADDPEFPEVIHEKEVRDNG